MFENGGFPITMRDLLRRLDETEGALELARLANETLETFEGQIWMASEYFREQGAHRQAMVSMLTETVADIWGQTDKSVARLQEVERQIERASRLDDIRMLKSHPGHLSGSD